jgi:nitroimidazol reductase NimA-like FMN-containing flavoprotein (pyridoxamine 5'-phosphate oxidase superfamily)
MTAYTPTPRTTLQRIPARGTYDRATVHAILDEALVCHLGYLFREQPFVIPTTFVRDGETLFVHGAAASRTLKSLASGVPVCVTVTLLDGLVLALSAFHHSMNYRSVMVLGTAREVTDASEKRRILGLLVDKVSPGRAAWVREPSDKELRATSMLALPLDEVSAKVRVGGPLEEPDEPPRDVWAGVVPLTLRAGAWLPSAESAPNGTDAKPPEIPVSLRSEPGA